MVLFDVKIAISCFIRYLGDVYEFKVLYMFVINMLCVLHVSRYYGAQRSDVEFIASDPVPRTFDLPFIRDLYYN